MKEDAEPAASPAAGSTGRGRGRGRGSRRRGSNRGGGAAGAANNSNAATSRQTNCAQTGRAPQRRGRAKNFTDPLCQAHYDRMRDLKAGFTQVAGLLKPAMEELARRQMAELAEDGTPRPPCPVEEKLAAQLKDRFDSVIKTHDTCLEMRQQTAKQRHEANVESARQTYENQIDDLYEQYYDGVLNRLNTVASLHAKQLPVDIRDDRFEYKAIDDAHLDEDFGPYREYLNGNYVPFPHRVPGTKMWAVSQAQMAEIVAEKEAAASAKAKATKEHNAAAAAAKRKSQSQPDGQPAPKRPTRTSTRRAGGLLPAAEVMEEEEAPERARGLLASANEVAAAPTADGEVVAAEEEASPSASVSPEAPEAPEAVQSPENGGDGDEDDGDNGDENVDNAGDDDDGEGVDNGDNGEDVVPKAQRSPGVPRTASDPDDYGVRVYMHRAADKTRHTRFIVPRLFEYDEFEIGFRDSTNDASRQKASARNKYTDTPNSSAAHLDLRAVNYDYSTFTSDDFDAELVRKHTLHPRFGLILRESVNEAEEADPYMMPGKPVVFIANPSGREVHASRSFQTTVTQRRAEDAPTRLLMGAAVRRFCGKASIEAEEVATTEYVETNEALAAKSLGTAEEEMRAFNLFRNGRTPTVIEMDDDEDESSEKDDASEEGSSQGEMEETETVEEATTAGPTSTDGDDHINLDMASASMSLLLHATAYQEAQEAVRPTPPAAATTTLTANSSQYDAIRDVFTQSSVRSDPAPPPTPPSTTLGFLALVCDVQAGGPHGASGGQQSQQTTPATPFARLGAREDARRGSMAETTPGSMALPAILASEAPVHANMDRMGYQQQQQPHVMPYDHYQQQQQQQQPMISQPVNAGAGAPPMDMGQQPQLHPLHLRPTEPLQQHGHLPQQQQAPPPLPTPQEHNAYFARPAPPLPLPPPPLSSAYLTSASHHQDVPMSASGRPLDPSGYHQPRAMGSYGSEPSPTSAPTPAHAAPAPTPAPVLPSAATHGHTPAYWHPRPRQRSSSSSSSMAPPPQHHQQHQYPPFPPGPAPSPAPAPRTPFSHNASAEPLPALRPSRDYSRTVHDEGPLRSSMQSGMSPYHPAPPPSRAAFPRANSYTEPPSQHHHRGSERLLPSTLHVHPRPPPSYLRPTAQPPHPPPPSFIPHHHQPQQQQSGAPSSSFSSPYGHHPPPSSMSAGSLMRQQSPPTTPLTPAEGSMLQHQQQHQHQQPHTHPHHQPQQPHHSLLSHQQHPQHHGNAGASSSSYRPPPPATDSATKYRRLAAAPMPAHRTTTAGQTEFKTIPYEYKETGGSAELPNSGPTTIRGWNNNPQPRRNRQDKNAGNDANDREGHR